MPLRATLISAAVLLAAQPALAAAPVQRPVVLACNMPARAVPPGAQPGNVGDRIFRIGPGSLQEWDAVNKRFGINLCTAYSCVRAKDRTEGTISSASVAYTIGVANGMGYWKVMGASGGGARSGSCRTVTGPRS